MAMSRGKFALISIMATAVCAAAIFCAWRYIHNRPGHGLTLYGNVDIRQVDLGFRVGGRIAEVLVDEGDKVQTGQPLAKLDCDLLAQQRDQSKAQMESQQANLARMERGYRTQEVAQARADVAAATAIAQNAAQNLHRVQSMRESNAISQRELDNATAADREARARLRSARDHLDMLSSGYREEEILAQRALVDAARAQLRHAEIQLADGSLYAPQEGIVLTRAREAGSIVEPGQTVYTLTLTNPTWLRAYVSEPDLGKIKPGMPVDIYVDAAPGQTFHGSVGFISPLAEFTPKTVETMEVRTDLVYRIRVQAQDPENVMRQGMPVTIFINTDNK